MIKGLVVQNTQNAGQHQAILGIDPSMMKECCWKVEGRLFLESVAT